MNTVARLGQHAIAQGQKINYLFSVSWAVVTHALRPRYWPRTVRDVLARQVLFTGIEAVRFVSLVAFMMGISVVVQTQLWLSKLGQSELLGPILVMVIIREAGPLLTNFIVIGRSGTAMATELGNMKVAGEVHVLDAQGLDPFTYLVLPRVIGAAVSVFCLTIVFIFVSFASGYLSGLLFGAHTGSPALFIDSVLKAVEPEDVFNVVAKSLIPGLLTGVICCTEGLSVRGAVTEVPQAATRAVVRSVAALFILSAVVSALTYL